MPFFSFFFFRLAVSTGCTLSWVKGFFGIVYFMIVLRLSALHHKNGAGGFILDWLMVSFFLFMLGWRFLLYRLLDLLSFFLRVPTGKAVSV